MFLRMQRDVNTVSAMILDLGHCKEVQDRKQRISWNGNKQETMQSRYGISQEICLKGPKQFSWVPLWHRHLNADIIIISGGSGHDNNNNNYNNNQKERVSHLKPSLLPSLQPTSWQKKFLIMHQESLPTWTWNKGQQCFVTLLMKESVILLLTLFNLAT